MSVLCGTRVSRAVKFVKVYFLHELYMFKKCIGIKDLGVTK